MRPAGRPPSRAVEPAPQRSLHRKQNVMVYLNILIGFSFIMLVFATGVSAGQSLLTRIFGLEGQAIVGPVLEALRRHWQTSELPAEAFDKVAAALRGQLALASGRHAKAILSTPPDGQPALLAALRQLGDQQLPQILGTLDDKLDVGANWQKILQGLEREWSSTAALASASYKSHTKLYVLGLSAVVVLLFNVDAIRILRHLSVDPSARAALVSFAETAPAPVNTAADTPATSIHGAAMAVTDWQRQELAELKTIGFPLGWQHAPLWACQDGTAATSRKSCSGGVSVQDTLLLWLIRLLGLALGLSLVVQGAPFWSSLVEKELGLKRAAGPPTTQPTQPTQA